MESVGAEGSLQSVDERAVGDAFWAAQVSSLSSGQKLRPGPRSALPLTQAAAPTSKNSQARIQFPFSRVSQFSNLFSAFLDRFVRIVDTY